MANISSQPQPPDGGAQTVRDTLAALGQFPDVNKEFFGGLDAASIGISEPVPAYAVSLNDVATGKLTSRARLTNWRYLLLSKSTSEPLDTADLVQDDDGKWVMAGINNGRLVGATATTLTLAKGTKEWQSGEYQLLLLQVPALYCVLVWLRGRRDLFLVVTAMESAPELALKPGILYDEAAVLRFLQDEAAHYDPGQA